MKILFHGYNTCCQNESGGVRNRMKTIKNLLGQREGIETELFNPYESKIKDFDIIHFFMLKYENNDLMNFAKEMGKKVVLSSIINLRGGKNIDRNRKYFSKLPLITTQNVLYDTINLADVVITESFDESKFIHNHYKVPEERLRVIPNGISIRHYTGRDIYDVIGDVEKYAIIIGRFDTNKNQLNVIKALKGTGVDIVFIGGPAPYSTDYYDECLKCAGTDRHFHFVGWVDHESDLFLSALSNADTLVFPSYQETFGLVALEAGVSGCKIVMSQTLPILGYKSFEKCYRFDPSSPNSIRTNVLKALNAPKDKEFAKKIEKEFSWDTVIDKHVELYSGLLR